MPWQGCQNITSELAQTGSTWFDQELLTKTQFENDLRASNHLARTEQKSLDSTGMRCRFLMNEFHSCVSVNKIYTHAGWNMHCLSTFLAISLQG
jgi:hypothetical protein